MGVRGAPDAMRVACPVRRAGRGNGLVTRPVPRPGPTPTLPIPCRSRGFEAEGQLAHAEPDRRWGEQLPLLGTHHRDAHQAVVSSFGVHHSRWAVRLAKVVRLPAVECRGSQEEGARVPAWMRRRLTTGASQRSRLTLPCRTGCPGCDSRAVSVYVTRLARPARLPACLTVRRGVDQDV